MRGARISWLIGVLAVVALLAAACTGDGELPTTTSGEGGGPSTTEAPATTEAPTTAAPTTEAPGTTEGGGSETTAPGAEEEGTFPIWLVVVAGVVVVGLLIWAAARGGKKDVVVAAAVPGWKERAQASYGASRWLYDSLTEGLAIWRGNAQFSGTTSEGSTAETGNAAAWEQLAGRMNQARDDLYAMEAAAPDPNTAQVARNVVDSLNSTRSAVDARAEARYNYRTVEAGSGADHDQALAEAGDREKRAGANLDAARQSLSQALTALSSVA